MATSAPLLPGSTARAIPRAPFPWRAIAWAIVVLVVAAWSAHGIGFDGAAFINGWPQMTAYFAKLMPWSGRGWPLAYASEITARMAETLKISLSATVLGVGAALPFVLVGTRPLAPGNVTYQVARALLNLIRTIPDLVLAALLVAGLGLGPLPGMLALAILTFGIIAKLLADAIETLDLGALEAIEAVGGTRLQGALFAVWPAIQSQFWSFTLYCLEVNVRVAAVLGLVGAGGIGQILIRDINFFKYGRVGMIIAATFLVVFIIDTISGYVREKLK
ncbi:phosphonate ABC transporter, permease protein PhnE [bacterium]|nr:MAG: phosphonate ABC transporter, permease protein PhnE [bacterium]